MRRYPFFFAMFISFVFVCNFSFSQTNHHSGDITTAEELEAVPLAATPSMRDITVVPEKFSLKAFAPPVKNQQDYSTCVAWSCAYAARTISYAIQHNFTNKDSIAHYSFSPGFLFYFIKKPGDNNCQVGTNILRALDYLSTRGVVLFKDGIQDCTDTPPSNISDSEAEQFKIKGANRISKTYGIITQNNIGEIKKSLVDKNPVVIGLKLTNSFENINLPPSGIWTPLPGEPAIPNHQHAMCIVGYDDNLNGGSFEVMNSWGEAWGNKGFFWLRYSDLMQYGTLALNLIDYEGTKQQELAGSLDFVMLDGTQMPVTREKINTRSISVVNNQQADYTQYRINKVYPAGTNFQLKFTTNAPAYVYIFADDDSHKISAIFPDNPNVSPAITSSNTTVYLPSETKHLQIDPSPGTDNICVMYSKEKLDINALEAYMQATNKTTEEAVKEKYGNKIISLDNINFADDAIKFTAAADENKIVCFFIKLEHN